MDNQVRPHERIKAMAEAQQQEIEDESECTFTPAITNKSRLICMSKDFEPIHERYKKEINRKNERMSKLRRQKEERDRSKLKEAKEKLQKKKKIKRDEDDHRDMYYRDIYSETTRWLQRRDKRILDKQSDKLDHQRMQENSFKFKPNINQGSRKMMKGTTFDDRLSYYKLRKQKKMEELNEKENMRNSFKPRLNPQSLYKVEALKQQKKKNSRLNINPNDVDENKMELIQMLSYLNKKSEIYENSHTFQLEKPSEKPVKVVKAVVQPGFMVLPAMEQRDNSFFYQKAPEISIIRSPSVSRGSRSKSRRLKKGKSKVKKRKFKKKKKVPTKNKSRKRTSKTPTISKRKRSKSKKRTGSMIKRKRSASGMVF